MAQFKFGTVTLELEEKNIKADFEILKDDVLWKTETMYLPRLKEADDIIEKIEERAAQIISHSTIIEDVFPDVIAALEGKIIKEKGA